MPNFRYFLNRPDQLRLIARLDTGAGVAAHAHKSLHVLLQYPCFLTCRFMRRASVSPNILFKMLFYVDAHRTYSFLFANAKMLQRKIIEMGRIMLPKRNPGMFSHDACPHPAVAVAICVVCAVFLLCLSELCKRFYTGSGQVA